MYIKAFQEWTKNVDFVLIDELSLLAMQLLVLAVFSPGDPLPAIRAARGVIVFLLSSDLVVAIVFGDFDNVLNRGYLVEAHRTVLHSLVLMAFSQLVWLLYNGTSYYPNEVLIPIWGGYFLLSYATRCLWKRLRRKYFEHLKPNKGLLVVTKEKYVPELVDRLRLYSHSRRYQIKLVLSDRGAQNEYIHGVEVVADLDNAADYLCRSWVDEVFFFDDSFSEAENELMRRCREMALTVHMFIPIQGVGAQKQAVSRIAGYDVLTSNIGMMPVGAALVKRTFDVFAGALGSLVTLLLLLILGPFLYAASPGPLIYAQERIGENGKRFRMYKIRSMYLDADARKAEFARQNTHEDGFLFKMDFDPRVIGNRITPDGKRKCGIGDFIRRTSLDEFPQFFNVLRGDMSVVGTRPPTPDEWVQYRYSHRARLSVKPGLTGLWQVRQDKDSMDFEQVVVLDTDYIANWSFRMDFAIIAKTVLAMLRSFLPHRRAKAAEEEPAQRTPR